MGRLHVPFEAGAVGSARERDAGLHR